MENVKLALVGVGGISQVVRIPSIKKMEDVELTALCDSDQAKVSFIADKFDVKNAYVDIQNMVKKEDLDGIKDEMDKLFSQLKVDIIPFRKPLLKGHHKEDLKASCVGVSFYKRPPLEINEKNMDIVKKSIETFFDAYVKVLEKRKDQPYGKNDIEAMFDMRRRWLEKQFFWDPMASTGLYPYEVFSFQDLPPKVTF